MNKTLISIVGPTAIGKTALSIKLAQHFKTEIISADSRQFYKEMKIGTAAPTSSELAQAKHHFIHHKSVQDKYTVGDFEKDAVKLLDKLFEKHDVVIMVGGSGLYINAVTKGLDDFPNVDPKIREGLNIILENEGLGPLQEQLKELDPDAYTSIAIDNPHRVIRALEVSIGSKQPYSSFLTSTHKKRNFRTITLGLTAERAVIYDRINRRVDLMIEQGLLDEVKHLAAYQDLNALNTVGYKELFNVLNGTWDFEFAISEIKKNSRRYAKRQMTWFKKNEDIIWIPFDLPFEKMISELEKKL
ncbi:MAG: tRNA (adenosine(37)-N6)-dimethylallyltransferase MiaA [Psychroserpens sp.]|nr:tRNA (adenosine(37)-N6)-dimethylallyltransferase MiaA [Psychroserpens sp.]